MSDTDSTASDEGKQKAPPSRKTFTPPKRQSGPPNTTTEQSQSSAEKRSKSFGEWAESDSEDDFD